MEAKKEYGHERIMAEERALEALVSRKSPI
jgi:hypothetical protein